MESERTLLMSTAAETISSLVPAISNQEMRHHIIGSPRLSFYQQIVNRYAITESFFVLTSVDDIDIPIEGVGVPGSLDRPVVSPRMMASVGPVARPTFVLDPFESGDLPPT